HDGGLAASPRVPYMLEVARRVGYSGTVIAASGQKLFDRPLPFFHRIEVVLMAVQLAIRECDAAEWLAGDVAGGWFAIFAKIETWCRTGVGVTPAIQHNSRNVAPRIELELAEQPHQLLP